MIGEITAAIAALKTTFDLVGVAIEKRDMSRLNEYKLTVTNELLKLNMAANSLALDNSALINEKVTLAQEKRDLEQRILDLETKYADLSHYKLRTLPSGAHIHIDDRLPLDPKAPVYFCTTCIETGQITTLQSAGYGFRLTCPRGHNGIDTGKKAANAPQQPRGDGSGTGWMR